MTFDDTKRWASLIFFAALVGLAANYLVYNFPLDEAAIIYEQY